MNGLPEFRNYTPKQGHPDYRQCADQAMELAEKIIPIIVKDRELSTATRLLDARRKVTALRKMTENLWINRKRYNAGDHALRPLYAIWTMLNACNFRCTYCDNHQGEHYFDIPDPERLDTVQGKALLDRIITGTTAIYWCGGEPTMRKDLPELLDYAWHLGFFPNMINTNGSLLHKLLQKPEWSRFLQQMDVIIVSLDGLDVAHLRELWGVKKPEQTITNLLLLRQLRQHVKFKLAVNTVITPESIDQARDVLTLAEDLDIWFVPVPVNFKHEPNRNLLENRDYVALAEHIIARKKAGSRIIGSPTLLKRLLFSEPYQCLTALKPHIWSDGTIAWPCRATHNVKPATISLLDHGTFDDAYRAGSQQVNPNSFHGNASNQCGGSCAWMQNYTTARYMDGITNPVGSGFIGEVFEFAFRPGR